MYLLLKKLSSALKDVSQEDANTIEELSEQDPDFFNNLSGQWKDTEYQEFESEPISEEDYLEQNVTENLPRKWTTHQKILENAGVKIVSAGGKSPILGQGSYGTVYRGIYKGKSVAAKVITRRDGLDEVHIWQKVLDASQNFPNDLKKHLPKIYAIERGYTHDENAEPYALIIMEELKPPSFNFEQLLLADILGKKDHNYYIKIMKQNFNNPEYMFNVAKNIYRLISNNNSLISKMSSLSPSEILTLIYGKFTFDSQERTKIGYQFAKELAQKYRLDSDAELDLTRIFFAATDSIFYAAGFPSSFDQLQKGNQMWKELPETQKYYEMLTELSKYGIEFDDQNYGNVMMDNDGNLKLIDVGNFDVF